MSRNSGQKIITFENVVINTLNLDAFPLHLNIYFRGTEMKIKMTAPVTSYVEPGSGPFSESTVTISLYIPSEQQSDPPRPAESDVFIEDRAEMTVFVR